MPINLNNLTKQNIETTTHTPRFFHNELTGNGITNTGLLNKKCTIDIACEKITEKHVTCTKEKIKNGTTTTRHLPFYTLTPNEKKTLHKTQKPSTAFTLAEYKTPTHTATLWCDIQIHSLTLESKTYEYRNKLTPCYQVTFYKTQNPSKKTYLCENAFTLMMTPNSTQKTNENTAYTFYTTTPKIKLDEILNAIDKQTELKKTTNCDDIVNNTTLYQLIEERSKVWQTSISDEIYDFLNQTAINNTSRDILVKTNQILKRLEQYNVPLEQYSKIHQALSYFFNETTCYHLCLENINLLMNQHLHALNKNKQNLEMIPQKQSPVPSYFSKAQTEAITTTNPLTLVQAGAGTGKTSTISERINHLKHIGIMEKDINVISFTNAAADNVKTKNPNIKSTTIASMIHTIYEHNFPNQTLSSLETLCNATKIYFPQDEIATHFADILYRMTLQNSKSETTNLNKFVYEYYDKVIEILNTVKQTTLELEIIICYQKLTTLNEPESTKSKHLIVDEVQDTSIFEFIYILEYVDKNKTSLFIVGDCSQTLYEFRDANPKALNALEMSNVFETHKLDINFRSNQEILTMANTTLRNIEANQYANIQLQSNNLTPITQNSFKNKVKIDYHQMNTRRDQFDVGLEFVFYNSPIRQYIQECLNKNEQITFLAYASKHVRLMEQILTAMHPDKTVSNITSSRTFNTTIFSKFIQKHWDEVKFIPTNAFVQTVMQLMIKNVESLVTKRATDYEIKKTTELIQKWAIDNYTPITIWQQKVAVNELTENQLFDNIKENMIDFEIQNGAMKNMLRQELNKDKASLIKNSNLIVSTIHSAKGLEFPNVVVLYKDAPDMAEDSKRMYYVALTRAMKSEYILAFGAKPESKIEYDYNEICASLTP